MNMKCMYENVKLDFSVGTCFHEMTTVICDSFVLWKLLRITSDLFQLFLMRIVKVVLSNGDNVIKYETCLIYERNNH